MQHILYTTLIENICQLFHNNFYVIWEIMPLNTESCIVWYVFYLVGIGKISG
jgi:hypothetical protein